jgi:hypothetical protein
MCEVSLASFQIFGFYDHIYFKTNACLSPKYIESTFKHVNLFAGQLDNHSFNIQPFIGIYVYRIKDKDGNMKITYKKEAFWELVNLSKKYEAYCLKTFGEEIKIDFDYLPKMCGIFKIKNVYLIDKPKSIFY